MLIQIQGQFCNTDENNILPIWIELIMKIQKSMKAYTKESSENTYQVPFP